MVGGKGDDDSWTRILFPVLLVALVVLAVGLRLKDPLSSPAMGAEDPYTHVVFTKEHLARGYFDDARSLGTSLYPPGLHAFTGIMATVGGVSLYDFARFSPAFFGGLSVFGIGLLGRRFGGTIAGLSAASLLALMPEHIVRTNLFFPTMVDLAFLPAFFVLFVIAAEREWGALPILALLTLVLAYTHPWIVPILAAIAGLYVALRAIRGGSLRGSETSEATAPRGNISSIAKPLALPAGLLVVILAIGAVTRWDHGNTGFSSFLADAGPLAPLAKIDFPMPILFGVILLLGAVVANIGGTLLIGLAFAYGRAPPMVRLVVSGLIGIGFAFAAWSIAQHPPKTVLFKQMLGPVAITLAYLGIVVAWWRPSALGDLASAAAIVLFPLAGIMLFDNVFDAKHWPARAVVYLAIGVVLLGAVLVQEVGTLAIRALNARRRAAWVVPAATLVTLMLVTSAVAASPAKPKDWYRLYPDDQFAGFERIADILEADPKARIVVASWQPGLVLKALSDPNQVRYSPKFFNMTTTRDFVHNEAPSDHIYVVVDRFLIKRMAKDTTIDLSFLNEDYLLIDQTSDQKFLLYKYLR